MSLAKGTIVKMFGKIRRYKLCSGVATYYVKSILVCVQCVVQNEKVQSHTFHIFQYLNMDKQYATSGTVPHSGINHLN